MSCTEHCRNCGIEIKPDITNPLALCDDCYKEGDKK
jgi:NMD protein affecting ribosome stability and mRNA decay